MIKIYFGVINLNETKSFILIIYVFPLVTEPILLIDLQCSMYYA